MFIVTIIPSKSSLDITLAPPKSSTQGWPKLSGRMLLCFQEDPRHAEKYQSLNEIQKREGLKIGSGNSFRILKA